MSILCPSLATTDIQHKSTVRNGQTQITYQWQFHEVSHCAQSRHRQSQSDGPTREFEEFSWIVSGTVGSMDEGRWNKYNVNGRRVTDLFEMITKLDDGCGLKHPILIDDKLTVGQRVDVALDQEEIRATLHRQEALARDVDPMCILEVFDSRTCCGFKLGWLWEAFPR